MQIQYKGNYRMLIRASPFDDKNTLPLINIHYFPTIQFTLLCICVFLEDSNGTTKIIPIKYSPNAALFLI